MTTEKLEKLLSDATPEPWETDTSDYGTSNVGGAYVAVCAGDGATIAHVLCYDMTGNRGSRPYAANARLIASAPDLARKVIAAEKLVEALQVARDNEDIEGMFFALAAWEARE